MFPEDPNEPQEVWKTQRQEEELKRTKFTPEELAAMLESRQRLNTVVRWGVSVTVGLLAIAALYHVWSAAQPWIKASQAWLFAVLGCFLAAALSRTPVPKHVSESAVQFLEHQHEERAKGYLKLRSRLWLILPSVAAAWLGRGAAPWAFILVLVGLVFVWLLLGLAAAKGRRDIRELHRSISGVSS